MLHDAAKLLFHNAQAAYEPAGTVNRLNKITSGGGRQVRRQRVSIQPPAPGIGKLLLAIVRLLMGACCL